MKNLLILTACAALALQITGCTDSTVNTKKGAAAGAVGGAIVGGIIGHQSGRGLEGAAIGAAAGGTGGAVVGSAKDEEESGEGGNPPPSGQ